MKKYRVKTNEDRVLGPLLAKQFKELLDKGVLELNEQVQEFPNGDWKDIREFTELKYLFTTEDPTLFRAISDLKSEIKKEEEEKIAFLDNELQKDHKEFRPGQLQKGDSELRDKIKIDDSQDSDVVEEEDKTREIAADIDKTVVRTVPIDKGNGESNLDKTLVVSVNDLKAEEYIEEQPHWEKDKKKEENLPKIIEEPEEEKEEVNFDDKTSMLNLSEVKKDLIKEVRKSEKEIKDANIKVLPPKVEKKGIDTSRDTEKEEKQAKRKRLIFKITVGCVLLLAALEIFMPKKEDKSFKIVRPKITFPIVFQNENKQKSAELFGKGNQYLFKGDYLSRVLAANSFRGALENQIGNNKALAKLVLTYGMLFKDSIQKFKDSREMAKVIQLAEKRVSDELDYVIGAAKFYLELDRPLSSKVMIERYLKQKKPISDILLTTYLESLIKIGNVVEAEAVYKKLDTLPNRSKDVIVMQARYKFFVEDYNGAAKILEDGVKLFPQSVEIINEYAKYLLYKEDFNSLYKAVQAIELLKADNSIYYYSELLKYQGILAAIKDKNAIAISLFKKSLKIRNNSELRKKLETLEADPNNKKELNVFINENKTIQLIEKSRQALKQEKLANALKFAIQAMDINPTFYPAVKQMSLVQRKRGHFKNAISMLEKYIASNPTNSDPVFDLIETYIEARKFEEVKIKLASIKQVDEQSQRRYEYALGRLYMIQGNYVPAINKLRKAINLDPLNDYVFSLLAEIYLKAGKYADARNFINIAIELNPGSVYYRSLYGNILFELDGADVAIGYVRDQLEDFKGHPQLIGDIAKYYYKSGQVKLFEEQLAKLLALPNKTADLFRLLFESAILEDDANKVIEYGTELILISPGDLERKIIFAEYLIGAEKYEKAFEVLEDIKGRLDTYPRLYLLISKIFLIKGEFDRAIDMGKKEAKNNPGLPEIHVLIGDIYVKKEDMVNAKSSYETAQSINPDYFPSLYGLGYVNYRLGRYETALQLLQKANEIDSNDPNLARQIGYVYYKLGQRKLASESFKVYLNLSPAAKDKAEIQRLIRSLK